MEIIDLSSILFAYIGAAIILYGGILTIIRTLQLELKRSIEQHQNGDGVLFNEGGDRV